MCKYCDNSDINEPLHEGREVADDRGTLVGIDVDIYGNTLSITACTGNCCCGGGYLEQTIQINFCPMCGEKLNSQLK